MEKILVNGNEAVGWGGLMAGADAFFGYPITPQNEITEWFAREFPKRGKVFVQSQSETGTINMLLGAAAAGARAMTSTATPGFALMQEVMSHLAVSELPAVIVLVQRGGPGSGHIRHSQTSYADALYAGGGGAHNIVLAPSSAQEASDFVQLAFYLADKYRNPVVVLSDAMTGQTMESLELRALEFGDLPDKDWAVRGRDFNKNGQRRDIFNGPWGPWVTHIEHIEQKYQTIASTEVRVEEDHLEDADLVLVAFGYMGRCCKEAVLLARAEGIRAGLLRPITLWPFPSQAIRNLADRGCQFLVAEDNMGQMVNDVRLAVEGRATVHMINASARDVPTAAGVIFPHRVFAEIQKLV